MEGSPTVKLSRILKTGTRLGLAALLAGHMVLAPVQAQNYPEKPDNALSIAESTTKMPAYVLAALGDATLMREQDKNIKPATPLQGSLTSIRVTRGRSQIVKFAQPVVRLSIAEPSMAEIIPLAPDQIMINGKTRGVTSLIVWDESGQEGIFDLSIQNDSSALLEAIEAVAPNENIEVRVTDDAVILTGQVSNSVVLDEIRKTAAGFGFKEADGNFINLTEAPVPQVHLEVRIAEANRSVIRQLKTSFGMDSSGLAITRLANGLDSTLLGTVNRAASGLVPGRIVSTSALAQTANNVGGITGAIRPDNSRFNFAWDMLQTNGKINILAEPTLVATHGRSASFMAGGEFPYVQGTDQNGSPLISFKEYGVKLNFTPWIAMRSGRIELLVAPEVSNLDSSNCQTGAGGTQVCGLLSRKTSTTVELADGESLLISGILTREEQNSFAQAPFIGELPILGNLFKNGSMQKLDRELVVIVTPRIVKPNPNFNGRMLGNAR